MSSIVRPGAPDAVPAPDAGGPDRVPAPFDVIVIGSGFGGTFVSHPLVRAGLRVLMIERGEWVPRGPASWLPEATFELSPHYFRESYWTAVNGRRARAVGSCACVGGASVFYGGVSLRFREADFEASSEIVGDSEAEWPFAYGELEPWYAMTERLLNVSGAAGADPTEPRRSGPYPQAPPELSETGRRIEGAARSLGLQPFRLPLAIEYGRNGDRPGCVACATCDTFACAIGAKNDLATALLPELVSAGLEIRTGTVARRLLVEGRCVTGVECVERTTGNARVFRARQFVLSAGALGSAHLLLASGLERPSPAGRVVGRYLMRHCSGIVFGVFRRHSEPDRFHKQVGLTDFYFGHPTVCQPGGKLGSLQQLQTPPLGLVRHHLPRPFGPFVGPLVRHATGLLVIAEDQPRRDNGVALEGGGTDRFGLPRLVIHHRHAPRDLAARSALIGKARQILRRAGARLFYVHHIDTFSHAVGTLRMGTDPRTSAVDSEGRYRGLDNLLVADGSLLPTSAGVNPSLTIAACALRIGAHLAREA